MKKTYINPKTIICEIRSTQSILIGSAKLGTTNASVDASGNLNNEVRGFGSDIWGTDEDYED